jgi:RNA polymerase subunit RPABC4/transcription elongation factor Spt4
MALIKCQECGQMISDKAHSCPHCGLPQDGYMYCLECGYIYSIDLLECPNCGNPRENVIRCSECNKVIPSNVESCPFCGLPIVHEPKSMIINKSRPVVKGQISNNEEDGNILSNFAQDNKEKVILGMTSIKAEICDSMASNEDITNFQSSERVNDESVKNTNLPGEKHSKNKKWIWMIILLCVLFILGICINKIDVFKSLETSTKVVKKVRKADPMSIFVGTYYGKFKNFEMSLVISNDSIVKQKVINRGSKAIDYTGKIIFIDNSKIRITYKNLNIKNSVDFPYKKQTREIGLGQNLWLKKLK